MATLSVLKFNDPYGAERVMVALQGMQERELIILEDAAVVSWPQGNRKPKTRELHGGSALGQSALEEVPRTSRGPFFQRQRAQRRAVQAGVAQAAKSRRFMSGLLP